MSVVTLTSKNFEQETAQEKKTVLIDFWAEWCGPCRMLSPVVDEIADESAGEIKVCKVNIDEQPELAERFDVMSIPTLVVLKEGSPVATSVGVKPKQAILKMVSKA